MQGASGSDPLSFIEENELKMHASAAILLISDLKKWNVWMRLTITVATALIATFTIFHPVPAADGPWDRETFERNASALRRLPNSHEPIIRRCSRLGSARMSDGMEADLERDTGMPAAKAIAEVCRRMIKGIASGTVSYEVYRTWSETPDDQKIIFPDQE